MWDTATAWLARWCIGLHLHLNKWTSGWRSRMCKLNHCATGLAPSFQGFRFRNFNIFQILLERKMKNILCMELSRLFEDPHWLNRGLFWEFFLMVKKITRPTWDWNNISLQGAGPMAEWLSSCAPLWQPGVPLVWILGGDMELLVRPHWGCVPHATTRRTHS